MKEGNATVLKGIVDEAMEATLRHFERAKISAEDLSVCLVDIRENGLSLQAGHREAETFYPASIVKLFYAVAAYNFIEQGKVELTDELKRALRSMIVDSSNDATSYIVDVLTGTTSGGELEGAEMESWTKKRNAINDHFHKLGYTNLNLNQKTWTDGPYGREQVFQGTSRENCNLITAAETARLMTELLTAKLCTPDQRKQLLEYMHRDKHRTRNTECLPGEDQTYDFIGGSVPSLGAFWSKAGWTSAVRHDVIYFLLPGIGRFVLVALTRNHSRRPEVLTYLGSKIIFGLSQLVGGRKVTGFRVGPLPPDIVQAMRSTGTFNANSPLPLERLHLVEVEYFDFGGAEHRGGRLVVVDVLAPRAAALFKELHQLRFPIQNIRPLHEYDADDDRSMADNNSSCYCSRAVAGTTSVSVHAYGAAIDINPLQNPYLIIDEQLGQAKINPPAGWQYLNRNLEFPGKVESIVRIAARHGFFVWGGMWTTPVDYHHFQVPRGVAELLPHLSFEDGTRLVDLAMQNQQQFLVMPSGSDLNLLLSTLQQSGAKAFFERLQDASTAWAPPA